MDTKLNTFIGGDLICGTCSQKKYWIMIQTDIDKEQKNWNCTENEIGGSMADRNIALAILIRYKERFAEQYGITALGVFGSTARDEAHN